MSRTLKLDQLIARCASWQQFRKAVAALSAKQKGDAFERLTQLYLLTKPEYQTSLKNVWLLPDVPQRVRLKLKKLPKPDEGIDLIGETRAGEFWAIQCKYKTDRDKALTVRELSTFTNLAFNTCAGNLQVFEKTREATSAEYHAPAERLRETSMSVKPMMTCRTNQ